MKDIKNIYKMLVKNKISDKVIFDVQYKWHLNEKLMSWIKYLHWLNGI